MEWISVNDRLPYKGEFIVLTWEPKSDQNPHGCFWGYDKVFFDYTNKEWVGPFKEKITHWMPLPNPPMNKKEKCALTHSRIPKRTNTGIKLICKEECDE